jgi:UDP-2,3-diacylglucosamine hydrolase
MALRVALRDPAWQRSFLARPLGERRTIAAELRSKSQSEVASKPEDIMDVSQATVEQVMRDHAVTLLLHGHTHRPGIHRFSLDGREATRIVLGAWHDRGSTVRWDNDGFELESFD